MKRGNDAQKQVARTAQRVEQQVCVVRLQKPKSVKKSNVQPAKKKRRPKGMGGIYMRKGKPYLFIKFAGREIATGLEDTPKHRKALERKLDEAYYKLKYQSLNIFEQPKTVPTIATAWKAFKTMYAVARTPGTVAMYKTAYNHYLQEHEHKKLERSVVTKLLVAGMRQRNKFNNGYELEEMISSITLGSYFTNVKVFLRWCCKTEQDNGVKYMAEEPDWKYILAHLKRESLPDPKIYLPDEIETMEAWFTANYKEEAVFFKLARVTGWRIHELMEIKRTDIKGTFLLIESKDHRKIERFPIWSEARPIVDAMLALPIREDGFIFSFNNVKKDYHALLDKLNLCFKQTGIVKDGRAWHELCKSFVSRIIRSGVPLDLASKICRKTVPVMLDYYRAFGIDELALSLEQMKDYEQTAKEVTYDDTASAIESINEHVEPPQLLWHEYSTGIEQAEPLFKTSMGDGRICYQIREHKEDGTISGLQAYAWASVSGWKELGTYENIEDVRTKCQLHFNDVFINERNYQMRVKQRIAA